MKRTANLLTVLVVLLIAMAGVLAPVWVPLVLFGGIAFGAVWGLKECVGELRDDIYNWLERRAVRET